LKAKPLVLHVEDNQLVTGMVRKMIGVDYNYVSVDNVHDALSIIKDKRVDLIILDLKLRADSESDGESAGYRVLESLKLSKLKVKVVILSALSEESRVAQESYPSIVKAIVNKPFRIQQLRDAISACL